MPFCTPWKQTKQTKLNAFCVIYEHVSKWSKGFSKVYSFLPVLDKIKIFFIIIN